MVGLRPLAVILAAGLGVALGWPAQTSQPEEFSSSTEKVAPAPATIGSTPMPSAPVLLALLRGTLAAVNQANVTGNYSVLRDLGAPSFRENYNSAELADRFRPWRENELDFAAILLLDAKLSGAPAIDADGMLRLKGYFPTSPLRVGFDLGFEAVTGNWRLATISVDARHMDEAVAGRSSAESSTGPRASESRATDERVSAGSARESRPRLPLVMPAPPERTAEQARATAPAPFKM